MAKNIQLHIPEPCHENWDRMSPVDKGRFCGSCQKQVVDFSVMSDRQVAEFFKKPSTGSVCGRFMTDQLDRAIPIPKKRIPWFRYFFTMALPAFFMTLKTGQARAQGKVKVQEDKSSGRQPIYGELRKLGMVTRQPAIAAFDEKKKDCEKPVADTAITDIMVGKIAVETEPEQNIRGRVIDRGGKPVAAAVIRVKGKKTITFSDHLGHYSIRMHPMDTLEVTAVSYHPLAIVPGRAGASELILEYAERFLSGEVMVVSPVPESSFKAQVTDENGNPVSFASITLFGKQVIVSNENGYFTLNEKQARKCKELRVSAAGYTGRTYIPGTERSSKGIEIIKLTRNEWLQEVVLANGISMGLIKTKRSVTGAVICTVATQHSAQDNPEKQKPVPAEIIVYPNPVQSGGTLTLQTGSLLQGYYQIQVMNTAGQLLMNREAWIDQEAANFSLVLPAIPAGNYFLVIREKGSDRNWSKKILVQ